MGLHTFIGHYHETIKTAFGLMPNRHLHDINQEGRHDVIATA